jgi:hypothetical protein
VDEQKVKCPDYCPAGWIMCEQVTAESEGGKAVKAKAMNQNINLGHPSNWHLANRNPPQWQISGVWQTRKYFAPISF